ncbi:MAG: PorT family protein [Bacteroidales bacterium]|nr:PorT family protein [Bacteroidales bacterium]
MKTRNYTKAIFTSLLLCVFAVSVNSAMAQRHKSNSRQFDYQLRGGINFCQIDGDASGSYSKIGFHAAVGTSFPLNDDNRLRFVVELGLSQKGSRIATSEMDRHISLLYVEVPLMLAYDFFDNKSLRISAGIAPAILAKANVYTDRSYDALHSNNYKTLDALPICISANYNITELIGVDVRYYNSMLNTAKENHSGTYRIIRSNKGQFNRLLQAGITLNF